MLKGRSPGLVVMGGDSCLKVMGSMVYYMELTFFTLICCKNCFVCLKRPKINEKVAQVGPLKKLLYAEIKLSDWLNEVTRYCHSIRVFFSIVKLHYSIICL